MLIKFLSSQVMRKYTLFLYIMLALFESMLPLVLLFVNVPAMERLISLIPKIKSANNPLLHRAIINFALVHLFYECLWRIRDWIKIKFRLQMQFGTFNRLIKDIIRFDSLFFRNYDTIAVVYILRQITDSTERILVLLIYMIRYLLYMILIPIKVISINKLCSYILSSWIFVWVLLSYILFRYISTKSVLLASSKNKLLSNLSDTLFNIDNIFIYKTYAHEETKLNRRLVDIMNQDASVQHAFWAIWLTQGTLFASIIYFTLKILGSVEPVEVGKFIALYKIINELCDMMWLSSDHILDFVENYGRLKNGLEVLSKGHLTHQISPITDSGAPDSLHRIEFRNVRFQHHQFAQFQFDCSLNEGELTALVGRSGSGKTTFIRLLLGMLSPDSGQIVNTVVSAQEIYPFTYIPQNIYLFNDTIRYNLTYGITREVSDSEIEAALKAASCEFIYALPKKYNTVIAKQNLSGGQAQRILIARSILMNSKILVFDEPTSALDHKTEMEIMEYIKNLSTTRIIIAHKINTIRSADKIIVFHNGSVVATGTDMSLQNNPFYRSLFEN